MHSEIKAMNASKIGFGDCSLVISCEYGGNSIASRYADLFQSHHLLLASHRGFDLGALIMAKELAGAFKAP